MSKNESHKQAHEGGADDTKIRFPNDEGKTEVRDPEPPMEEKSSELPEPTGTDSAATSMVEPEEGAENFDKETGFFTDDKKSSK